uniref:FH2 domain-containing protein n=1 Tax=Macrostomum lignano TaxID=282301 RepID=A0A1I8I319_9PLAT
AFEDSASQRWSLASPRFISVCRQLYESRSVRKVLSLVLALGSRTCSTMVPAEGALMDSENTCTLFQVLVSMYIDEYWESGSPELGTVVPFPLPDPEEVKQAAEVDLAGVKGELRHLSARLIANEKIVRKVATSSAPSEREPFAKKMNSFLDRAKKDLSEFRETVTDAETCYCNILMYFCQPPSTPPKEFFSHWAAFCVDFKEQLRRQVNLRQRGVTKFNISSSVESNG